MHHGVKAGGDSSKANSDICRSDNYLVINDLCKLCREMSCILVITGSSFSTVCVAETGEEATCCGWSPGPGFSLFPCTCPAHSEQGSETPGICMWPVI